MSLWQASLWLVVLAVGAVAFISILGIVGLKTDRTGGNLPRPEETAGATQEATMQLSGDQLAVLTAMSI
jgi:hypothetical protein